MAELFEAFTTNELAPVSSYWRAHNGGPLVLDDRLPSLADHQAIQRWVVHEFQLQLEFAVVRFNLLFRTSRESVRLHCAEELAAQNRQRTENLHQAKYTIEGYEHFRFSMLLMKKVPRLEVDALNCICRFLLGRAIANLHFDN